MCVASERRIIRTRSSSILPSVVDAKVTGV